MSDPIGCGDEPAGTEAPAPRARLRSLDVFRGADIGAMLLVNITWDRSVFPQQFFHQGWNGGAQGVTFTDLVFPWFLVIAGVAIPFSMAGGRGRDRGAVARIAIAARRGLLIYLCGCLLVMARTEEVSLLTWDILQVIGVAYFLGVVFAHLGRVVSLLFVVVVLLGKWYLLRGYVHPDFGEVVWTPDANGQRHLAATLGWFGGFLQALPATCVVLLGAAAGSLLRRRAMAGRSAAGPLTAAGLAAIAVAWTWQLDLPFSKDYFTSSYVLLSAGTGMILLALTHAMFDRDPLRPSVAAVARFFEVFGSNAIALYLVAELSFRMVLSRWQIPAPGGQTDSIIGGVLAWLRHGLGDAPGAWAHAVGYVLAWWLVMAWFHRRRIFLRL